MARPKLREYQKDGVRFMRKAGVTWSGRSINADDMGMGKTGQAIVTAHYLGHDRTLVVVPNALRWNWQRELKKWLPKADVTVCDGSGVQKLAQVEGFTTGFLVVNIDFIRAQEKPNPKNPKRKLYEAGPGCAALLKKGFYFAVFDEAHRCCNRDSLQSRGARMLAHAVPRVTLLTGTPMRGKVTNLWHLLHMADKKRWSAYWKWAALHAGAHKGEYGWEVEDKARDPAKLEREIAPVLIRRTKEDHLDLPPLTHQELWVPLEGKQLSVYREMDAEMVAELKDGSQLVAPILLAKLIRLKQIAVSPMLIDETLFPIIHDPFIKLDEESDDIDSYMKHAKFRVLREILEGTDEKVIVFSQFERAVQIVADLCRRLEIGCVTYTGSTADKRRARDITGKPVGGPGYLQRDYNEQVWKEDPKIPVLAATTSAGGIGLNWQEAGVMVRLDKLWVPDDNEQAMARMHRIGQTKPTTLIDILAEKTVEEWIEGLLVAGQNVNDQILSLVRERIENS